MSERSKHTLIEPSKTANAVAVTGCALLQRSAVQSLRSSRSPGQRTAVQIASCLPPAEVTG